MHLPDGFASTVARLGVKDGGTGSPEGAEADAADLVVIAAAVPVPAAGVFTLSRFAGPSVEISRAHLAGGAARGIVVVSRNANVANGTVGERDARAVLAAVADRLGCRPTDLLLASTGVIGRRYPLERMLGGLAELPAPCGRDAEPAARAIMTTDTVPKLAEAVVGDGPARVVGLAKGVGMVEPDMATMIAVVLTDAAVPAPALDAAFRSVVTDTFNCVSVDTDTSTSDTAVVLASGAAGPVDDADLQRALFEVCRSLTRQIARDGEGAGTLIEVRVDRARDRAQAKRVAKAIVNSPLVKTAVHGADPNWGRVAMAIGKCQDDLDIDQHRVVIRFGDRELYPASVDDAELAALSDYLRGDEVLVHVSLGTGDAECTVWGCDLTAGYVRINADYTS